MIILNSQQTRNAEIEMTKRGIALIKLMDNAGTAAAQFIMEQADISGKRVAVICGKGNNGGDGYVIARILHEHNADVAVILAMGEPTTEDAKTMFGKIGHIEQLSFTNDKEQSKNCIFNADIIVDCIFGIGFSGVPRSPIDELIADINSSKAEVYSIDIPSGMDCDTGSLSECVVKANHTITFTTLKPCHVIYPAKQSCGKVTVKSVGIDEDICQSLCNMEVIETKKAISNLPSRFANSNKGSYGRLLTLCGSKNMPGACVLSANAAMRCGTGLVQCALPECILPVASSKLTEAIFLPLEYNADGRSKATAESILQKANRPTSCLIGCGLGLDEDIKRLVADMILSLDIPIILDADGINAIVENKNILKEKSGKIILTPHPGEMARLCDTTPEQIQSKRLEYATDFAKSYGVIMVLKGANTIVTDGCNTYINTTGNAGMAKAGSGDVLSGMIGGFLAQGLSPINAAISAVHLHGMIGDYAAKRFSRIAMQPSDMINMMCEMFCDLLPEM